MFEISTTSSKKTKEAARSLVEKVLKKPAGNSALIIALTGDLGAGKTTFVQGFCKGIGVKKRITSPTFVLVKSYKLKTKSYDKIDYGEKENERNITLR